MIAGIDEPTILPSGHSLQFVIEVHLAVLGTVKEVSHPASVPRLGAGLTRPNEPKV